MRFERHQIIDITWCQRGRIGFELREDVGDILGVELRSREGIHEWVVEMRSREDADVIWVVQVGRI